MERLWCAAVPDPWHVACGRMEPHSLRHQELLALSPVFFAALDAPSH